VIPSQGPDKLRADIAGLNSAARGTLHA